jgi:type III restriction enzyme
VRSGELAVCGRLAEEYVAAFLLDRVRLEEGRAPKTRRVQSRLLHQIGNHVFVVEIKDDGEISDPSLENQKKYQYGVEHFARLNEWLEKAGLPFRYQLNFLTPKDYNKFFNVLQSGDLAGFRSQLDIALKKATVMG